MTATTARSGRGHAGPAAAVTVCISSPDRPCGILAPVALTPRAIRVMPSGRSMSSLDPRDPLVFDIRDLGRRAGSMMEVDRTVPAPADLGGGVAVVQPGSDLELRPALRGGGGGRAGLGDRVGHRERRVRTVPGPGRMGPDRGAHRAVPPRARARGGGAARPGRGPPRPRAGRARCCGAGAPAGAAVPGRLPRAVRGVRCPAGRRPDARTRS